MVESEGGGTIWAAAASDIGLVRSRNEDGLWLGDGFLRTGHRSVSLDASTVQRGVLLAVADGVGGAAAGDVASKFVLEQMARLVELQPAELTDLTVGPWMQKTAAAANDLLVERAKGRDETYGMSTTFTGVYFRDMLGCWINAGDSRLYAFREGSLIQISRDHTLREMTGDPSIPGNIITNCFGTRNDFYLDFGLVWPVGHPTSADGIFLICSDGLSDYAEHTTLESIMRGCATARSIHELDAAAALLVNAARAGGGGDNITCMIVQHRGT